MNDIGLANASVLYNSSFIDSNTASKYKDILLKSLNFSKHVNEGRPTALYGDPGTVYKYATNYVFHRLSFKFFQLIKGRTIKSI